MYISTAKLSDQPFSRECHYLPKCDYKCSKESDYKKHLSTRKHKMETNGNKTRQNSPYICECGIEYKTRSGLFKHKQKCKIIKPEDKQSEPMLEYLLKENIEMKKMLFLYKILDKKIKNEK